MIADRKVTLFAEFHPEDGVAHNCTTNITIGPIPNYDDPDMRVFFEDGLSVIWSVDLDGAVSYLEVGFDICWLGKRQPVLPKLRYWIAGIARVGHSIPEQTKMVAELQQIIELLA